MLITGRQDAGAWQFTSTHPAINAGASENVLSRWAIDALPRCGIVVGWQLPDGMVAPLLGAAREGDPYVTAAFLAPLMTLFIVPSVDLALSHGGTAAPPLASILSSGGP